MNNIKSVWIGTEEKEPIHREKTELDDNSDVIVTFENGDKYIATFFTYENIESLRQKNQKTGECLNGKYFCATDMILIEKLNRKEVLKVINHQIKEDEFYTYFDKIIEK